jgi:hypothetical protein
MKLQHETALVYGDFRLENSKTRFSENYGDVIWWAQFVCTFNGNFESTIIVDFNLYIGHLSFRFHPQNSSLIRLTFQKTLLIILLQKFVCTVDGKLEKTIELAIKIGIFS